MRYSGFISIIIYAIPILLCILAHKYKNKHFIFAFLVYTFLMTALRFNIATDFGRYYNRAFYRTELGLSFNEPIEMLFFFISSKAGIPRLFFMFNAAVVSICGYFLYRQYKDHDYYELMFIAYYFIILVGTFVTRYCAAAAVICVGVYFLMDYSKHKRNILCYLLLTFAAFCFHTGAIVTLVFPLLLYIYDLIKRSGIFKYSYTITIFIIVISIPLVVFIGELIIEKCSIFDKFLIYFIYFKECIPDNIIKIVLLFAAICAVGFLFDMLDMAFNKNKYIRVFSIGGMMFIFFLIMALFGGFSGQSMIDVFRIGAIFGFQSVILFIFVICDTNRRKTFTTKLSIGIITAIYVSLLAFCVFLGYWNAFPYNTDTTVPWGSDSAYIWKNNK